MEDKSEKECCCHSSKHRSDKEYKDLMNRLSRIEGQVNIDNQDWVWGIGLLISGAFIAILAWKYGVEKLRTQEVNAKGADVHLPKAYYTGCMYLIPVLVVIMVVYWLLQTKEWFPDTWLNPFIIQDNTGTVLLQFGVVILVGLALSKFFNTKTARGAMKDNKAAK